MSNQTQEKLYICKGYDGQPKQVVHSFIIEDFNREDAKDTSNEHIDMIYDGIEEGEDDD